MQTETTGAGTESGAGGPASKRYVINPANENEVIDMRHFLVVGPQGETSGFLIELLQQYHGIKDSAFDAQDFLSNKMGNDFYNNYYKKFNSWLPLDVMLNMYFQDLAARGGCEK